MLPIKNNNYNSNNKNTNIKNSIFINKVNVNIPDGTERVATTAISTAAGLKLAKKIPNKVGQAALIASSVILPEIIRVGANYISK